MASKVYEASTPRGARLRKQALKARIAIKTAEQEHTRVRARGQTGRRATTLGQAERIAHGGAPDLATRRLERQRATTTAGAGRQRALPKARIQTLEETKAIGRAGVKAAKKGVEVKAPDIARRISAQPTSFAASRVGRLLGGASRAATKLGGIGIILEGVRMGLEEKAKRRKRYPVEM